MCAMKSHFFFSCLALIFYSSEASTWGGLYPRDSVSRETRSLDGIWDFRLSPLQDPARGFNEAWFQQPLRFTGDVIRMPVPSSYNDVTEDKSIRDHIGWAWYDRTFFIPTRWVDDKQRIILRVGSAHYNSIVYVNGIEVASHEGGHLPIMAEITNHVIGGEKNLVTICMNNTLTPLTIPQGEIVHQNDETRYPPGYFVQTLDFDFFNYAGLHRPIYVYTTPQTYIEDILVTTDINADGTTGSIYFNVTANSTTGSIEGASCSIKLYDQNDTQIKSAIGCEGRIDVENANLWWPYLMDENSGYMYTLQVALSDINGTIDVYSQKVGIRVMGWNATTLTINGKPLYLMGCGKHEDANTLDTKMSNDQRKRQSGCQYKKRRLEIEAERQKQVGALQNYIQSCTRAKIGSDCTKRNDGSENPASSSVINENTKSSEDDDDKQMDEVSKSIETDDALTQLSPDESIEKIDTNLTPAENVLQTLSTDPALWPRILGHAERSFLVRQGPPKPLHDYKFPSNDAGRHFSANYYARILSNGEQVLRDWLVYSLSQNCVYCFCCKIFGCIVSSLSKEGFKSWKHLGETLKEHEISKSHIQAQKSWLEMNQRLKCCKTIDATAQRIINAETNHWNEVLLRIVAITKMLGKSSLAFQGTSDKLFEHNNGNFLKIVELLSEFDPIMEEHVRRVLKKGETKVHYLGKNIQNEIIDLLHQTVKSYIIDEIKKSKYFSIILDCTPDISKVEQMTLVIRYVSINKFDADVEIKINENFLGFLPVERSTGKQMSDIIIAELNNLGLNLQDIRGQGYDNGSNMRGDKAGVQSRIKQRNSRAFYVPCSSHSLNLVVNDMAKASLEAANFFNMVQKIYLFFSASTFRWAILLKHVQGLTLKPLSDTRWESRIEALKPLRFQLGDVYDALLSIFENQEIDNLIRDEASGLLNCIKQFKFLCSIVIWHKILNCINPISKLMQTKDFDLPSALDLLQNCKMFFKNLRSDSSFNETIIDAKELATEIDVEADFGSTITLHRVRRIKRNFSYEARDEPIKDPKEKYKIYFFYFTIDQALNALDARFEHLSNHSNHFQFLYNIYDLNTMSKEMLLKHCKNLECILTDGDSVDINGIELAVEISAVSALLGKKESPSNVLSLITKLNFAPNLSIALRILLTIPITVASGERSFSKLKLIKNFLRSTTTQNRLNGLAILSIEHEIADQINLKDVIKKFAELKVRKISYL